MMEIAMSLGLDSKTFGFAGGRSLPFRERLANAIAGFSVKALARITGRSVQAAERWKASDNVVSTETLFALAREIDEVWDLVREQCGRANDVSDAERILKEFAARLQERKSHGR